MQKAFHTVAFAVLFPAVAFILTACGGGGGGSTGGAPPIATPPAPPVSGGGAINVDSGHTAGDWTSQRYDSSGSGDNELQTTITASNVASLAPAWTFTGTVGSESSVAVESGTVYRTEIGGYVYAINEATGLQTWAFSPVTAESFVPSPLFVNGMVYLESTTGRFYVVNAASGTQAFLYPDIPQWGPHYNGNPNGHYRGSPIYKNGVIYTGASNVNEPGNCMQGGQVLALDPLSPTVQLVESLTPAGTYGTGVWSQPVFDANGDMFVATGNSCTFNLGPNGDSIVRLNPENLNIVWHSQGPVDAHDYDFGSTPVVINDEIVDAGKDGYVYAYDTQTGQLLWKYGGTGVVASAAAIGPLATDGNYIAVPYTVAGDRQHGAIVVFDTKGNVVWSLLTGTDPNHPGKGVVSAAAISHGMLFIGYTKANCTSSCDGVSAFDLASGKELWRYPLPTPVFGGIAIVNGGLFVSEVDRSKLYCFLPGGKTTSGVHAAQTYGTKFTGPYYYSPWIRSQDVEGSNLGTLRTPL
ncbi:MAG: PQQ-binding-like beta-propeller repeat protein [Candidatus Aquilonibacter sp.]